jgi:hypothetical protein
MTSRVRSSLVPLSAARFGRRSGNTMPAMTKGAYTLSDIDWPVVRLYCPACHRFAQFKRSTLLKRFGRIRSCRRCSENWAAS